MTDPMHNENLRQEAIARLLSWFKDDAEWQTYVGVLADEVQELEDAAWDVIVQRQLDSAEGAQLDQWGDLLDEDRQGLGDDEYRGVLRAKILVNLSQGRADDLYGVAIALASPLSVWVVEYQPATVLLIIQVSQVMSTSKIIRVVRLLTAAKPAGVKLFIAEALGTYFSHDEDVTPGASGWNVGGYVGLIGSE